MKEMPAIKRQEDGSIVWEVSLQDVYAKIYLPAGKVPADLVNYGFLAPYLMVFEQEKQTMEEAVLFADSTGLSKVAARCGGSVAFFYPSGGKTWDDAPADLFEKILAESRIHQYYQDGVVLFRDRFTKSWGEYYIRGGAHRTCVYGFGSSADYIARNLLKTVEGEGLYGRGDVTPAVCILQGLTGEYTPERRDIPVLSIGNDEKINAALQAGCEHFLAKERADYEADFGQFVRNYRRMMGRLEWEDDLEQMGMVREPAQCVVKTAPDNRGDDADTAEHGIGYVAYYNRGIMDGGKKAPLVLCFHGGGDSAMCMATVSGWYQVAARHDFLLVCVENHLNSTATEVMELLEHLKGKYAIDTQQIYSTGFSMGGCKSWDLMQEYPGVFAGVAPMDATFEVGSNIYGQEVGEINRDITVPVFYVGGEQTPLPELPFQAQKCVDRMAYVFAVNQVKADYQVDFTKQEEWVNPIWGIDGDAIYRSYDPVKDGTLTLHLFESRNGSCYAVFGSVSGQGHEVRPHTCERAWRFLREFRRMPDGSLEGGMFARICEVFDEKEA